MTLTDLSRGSDRHSPRRKRLQNHSTCCHSQGSRKDNYRISVPIKVILTITIFSLVETFGLLVGLSFAEQVIDFADRPFGEWLGADHH